MTVPMRRATDSPYQELVLDALAVKCTARLINALNHPFRQKLLQTIYMRKKVSVTDLFKELGVVQSVASMHLAKLRQAGFVQVEQVGRSRLYSVDCNRLEQTQQLMKELLHTSCLLRPEAG